MRRRGAYALALALALLASSGCSADPAERLEPEVVRRIEREAQPSHPQGYFTQGLLWSEGRLYESTGGRANDPFGPSRLLEVALEDDRAVPVRARTLDADLFAEGLARVGDELVQLTWQRGRALRWNEATFEPTGEHRYEGEGWGLCFDGERLVMSDGSDTLQFRDPDTFAVQRRQAVTLDGEPLQRLNELECVDGAVWANVWYEDRVVRIDPGSGRVTGVLDASTLLRPEERAALGSDAVLNGIAWDPARETFLLTGKLWPALFEVRPR